MNVTHLALLHELPVRFLYVYRLFRFCKQITYLWLRVSGRNTSVAVPIRLEWFLFKPQVEITRRVKDKGYKVRPTTKLRFFFCFSTSQKRHTDQNLLIRCCFASLLLPLLLLLLLIIPLLQHSFIISPHQSSFLRHHCVASSQQDARLIHVSHPSNATAHNTYPVNRPC